VCRQQQQGASSVQQATSEKQRLKQARAEQRQGAGNLFDELLSTGETQQCRLTGELCSVLLGCTDYSLLNGGYISIYSV